MSDDHDFPKLVVNTAEPTHVDDFRCKDHFPDEVAEQWDAIRSGRCVHVDEEGRIVESLQEAYCVLHPSYAMAELPGTLSGMRPGDLPPVTGHRVGEPEGTPDYEEWIDPETEHFMVTMGEATVDITETYADE